MTMPEHLFKKLNNNALQYVVAGELKKGKSIDELIKRFQDSAVGTQIPGRSRDAQQVVNVLRELSNI